MAELLNSIGYNSWILPVLLFLPLAGAVAVWIHGAMTVKSPDGGFAQVRLVALSLFVFEAVLSLGLWWSVNPATAAWQGYLSIPWIPMWGVAFKVGVDGIAMMLILLTTLLMPLAVLGGWTSIREKAHSYYALLFILTTGMLGVFMALDLVLFYVMWELMLVPMYLIIGIWGGQRRLYASLKFFLYTMAGGYGVRLFGAVDLHNPIGTWPALATAARYTHMACGILLALTIAGHVAVVLRHQIWLRDGLLFRMLPGRQD